MFCRKSDANMNKSNIKVKKNKLWGNLHRHSYGRNWERSMFSSGTTRAEDDNDDDDDDDDKTLRSVNCAAVVRLLSTMESYKDVYLFF